MKNFALIFGIGFFHLAAIGKLKFAVSSEVEKCYCGCTPTDSNYDLTGSCTDSQVGCGIQIPGGACFGLCFDSDDTEYLIDGTCPPVCTDKVACSFGKCINKFDPDTGCENFCPDESSNCKYNPKCPTYKNENGCPLPEACVGTMSAIKKGDGTAPAVWRAGNHTEFLEKCNEHYGTTDCQDKWDFEKCKDKIWENYNMDIKGSKKGCGKPNVREQCQFTCGECVVKS